VDSFYVCNPSGTPVDGGQRRRVEAALAEATQGAAPPVAVDTPT
jgi:[protein-PII] uridylyltransferase